MSKNKFENFCNAECPVKGALDVLNGKWTIMVLRDLLSGPKRFGELRKSLGGLNPNTLTSRLRHLEKNKILSNKIYPQIPPKVEYKLTSKGLALQDVIQALGDWGERWT